MVDKVTPETRSKIMSKIPSKGNRSTEWCFRMMLVRNGIKGWNLQPKGIDGHPDFAFPDERIAIFIDGCFWHGCPKCGHIPKSNVEYWSEKIQKNMKRDRIKRSLLREQGWLVIHLWEHDLKSPQKALAILVAALKKRQTQGNS